MQTINLSFRDHKEIIKKMSRRDLLPPAHDIWHLYVLEINSQHVFDKIVKLGGNFDG